MGNDLHTLVLSLGTRQDRRDQLDLPLTYEVLLQEPFTCPNAVPWSLANAGCMLAHRQAVSLAKDRGWPCVLVLEDDSEVYDAECALTDDLATAPITFLGGIATENTRHDKLTGLIHVVMGSHAVLYRADAYDGFLSDFPTKEQMENGVVVPSVIPFDFAVSMKGVAYKRVFDQRSATTSDINPLSAESNHLGDNSITKLITKQLNNNQTTSCPKH